MSLFKKDITKADIKLVAILSYVFSLV